MKIAFVDVETTGLDPEVDELIEVCVMIWDDQTGACGQSWSSRFMPLGPCGKEAQAVNGFDRAVWERSGAKPFDVTAAATLGEIIRQGAMIGGCNPQFDVGFLKAAFRRVRQPWKAPYRLIDVGSLAMPLVHAGVLEGRGLDDLAELFGLGPVRHNACDDTAMTIQAYTRLCEVFCSVADQFRSAEEIP